MSDLTVRRYEPEDAAAVWDLHERALRAAGAFDPELTHLDADLERIEAVYLDAGGTFLVGESGGEVVAMGAARPLTAGPTHEAALALNHEEYVADPDGVTLLKRMRVRPSYYRQGFGSAILAELADWAASEGFDALLLDTTATQERAIAFYESHGFETVGRAETEHATVLFYRKRL